MSEDIPTTAAGRELLATLDPYNSNDEWTHRRISDILAIEVEAVKSERARLREFPTWGDLRRDLQWSGADPEDHQAIRDERIAKTDAARDEFKAAVAALGKTYRDRKSAIAEEEWRKHKALEDRLVGGDE